MFSVVLSATRYAMLRKENWETQYPQFTEGGDGLLWALFTKVNAVVPKGVFLGLELSALLRLKPVEISVRFSKETL
jgi:hypothetical protein